LSLTLGKIFGIEIRLHYTWFIVFIFITWSLATGSLPQQYPGLTVIVYWIIGAISAIILFVSVLFHELCHSYVAIRNGLPVPNITLFIFGGVSQIAEEPKTPSLEFRMAFVGPLSSFALAAVLGAGWLVAMVLNLGAVIIAPLNYGFLINLLLGGFNLLPAFPLDGGRVLRAKLWSWKNDLIVATKISTKVGDAFAYGLVFIGFFIVIQGEWISGLWLVFIGWFLKNGADASLRETIVSQALSEVSVRDIMNTQVITLDPDITIAGAVDNYFYKYKHQGYPVVQGDKISGIITIHDLQRLPKEVWSTSLVKNVMTPAERLVYVKPEEPALEAMIKLSRMMVGRLPVLEGEKVVGIVTRSDLMGAIRTRTELAR
jgi:Zn-dependent protease/predicted transcriptional regulator